MRGRHTGSSATSDDYNGKPRLLLEVWEPRRGVRARRAWIQVQQLRVADRIRRAGVPDDANPFLKVQDADPNVG